MVRGLSPVSVPGEKVEKRRVQQGEPRFQQVLPEDDPQELCPPLRREEQPQAQAEADNGIDHRVPHLTGQGGAVVPQPPASPGAPVPLHIPVPEKVEHQHVPGLGDQVGAQTANDKDPVLPQQRLIGPVHHRVRGRERPGDHDAGGGEYLPDQAVLHHALCRVLPPDLADDVRTEEGDGVGDSPAAQGKLEAPQGEPRGDCPRPGHVGDHDADDEQRHQHHEIPVVFLHASSYSCEPAARSYFCLQMVAQMLAFTTCSMPRAVSATPRLRRISRTCLLRSS